MRGNLGIFKNVNGVIGSTGITNGVKYVSCSGFSSSSGGDGRGRGRGSVPPKFDFVASQPLTDDSGSDRTGSNDSGPVLGHGHGRGRASPPKFNAFSVSNQPGVGRGRGGVVRNEQVFEPKKPVFTANDQGGVKNEQVFEPKKPVFIAKDEETGSESVVESVGVVSRQPIGEKNLPASILSVITGGGAGRGKPDRKPAFSAGPTEPNRHLKPRQPSRSFEAGPTEENLNLKPRQHSRTSDVGPMEENRHQQPSRTSDAGPTRPPRMSREEAVKKAVGLLSRPDKDPRDTRGGPAGRGRGGPRRWGDQRLRQNQGEEEEEDEDKLFCIGDDADGERFAKLLGPENMNELTEAFEEMGSEILPDPEEDEYIEALDTNLKIELEPEYLFGDLDRNPDIDEKPLLSLREVLEKQKQFLVAYEGMETNEEWEDYVKDAMERVPVLEEIVDHYCGPDRVTAKQQQEELERVAKTLPATAPDSWKRFTDNAVRSLQSNPGWGFHRKWQFMDKLVAEASKSYK